MGPKWWKKIALYLSVDVFSRKVLIGDTIFTSHWGDGTAVLRGHLSHTKVYPFAGQRKYLHYSVIFRPWVLLRPRDVEPTTSRSAVKRSTDWANPAAVKMVRWNIKTFYFFLFLILFSIILWVYYVVFFRSKLKCFHLLGEFFTFHPLWVLQIRAGFVNSDWASSSLLPSDSYIH